jgi:hypothetical protein
MQSQSPPMHVGSYEWSQPAAYEPWWYNWLLFPRFLVLIAVSFVTVLIVGFGGLIMGIVLSHSVELSQVGTWPAAEVPAAEVAQADLSHLGLKPAAVLNARSDPGWRSSDWSYQEGTAVHYAAGDKPAASIWALKYESAGLAESDFAQLGDWAMAACRTSIFGAGVVRCQQVGAFEKIYLHDVWIVNIQTGSSREYGPEDLSNKVRDALVVHWKGLPGPRS